MHRVIGPMPQPGHSAPRLMRVDQKQTGQWSRTVTATRPGSGPARAPSAESECWAWTTAALLGGQMARDHARDGQAPAAGRAQAADVQPVEVVRSRARGEHGDGSGRPRAGRGRGRASTIRRPPRAAGRPPWPGPPSRGDPQQHPLELLAVTGPRVSLDHARARARAEAAPQRGIVGQAATARRPGRPGSPSRACRPSWPSRTMSVSGARGIVTVGRPEAMYSKIFSGDQ